MRESRPERPESELQRNNPELIHQLRPVTQRQIDAATMVVSSADPPMDRAEQGRAAETLGATALRQGNFPLAQQRFAQAIALLQGEVPDVQLMPLLSNHASACLGRNVAPEHALGRASEQSVRAALPSLRRLVEISEANAAAVDGQDRAIRPEHHMNLAYAQTRLHQYADGAASYLRAIDLLSGPNGPADNAHTRGLLRNSLNNYIFCLQELPRTDARTQEIQRRLQQLEALERRR